MKIVLKILVSSLAVFFTANLLPGVYVDGFPTAILVAVILGLLNNFVKPVLVFLTIPLTIFTFGLFLLVINAFMIILVGQFLAGFIVSGFWPALFFSIIVSLVTSLLETLAANRSE